MATFVLIHGSGDVGWYWHLVEAELRSGGHDTVAPDLPCDDDSAGLSEYVDAVVQAIGDRMSGGRGRRQADGIAPPLPAHVSHRRFTRHGMSDPGELRRKGRHGH